MKEWIEFITESNAKIEAIAELMQMVDPIMNSEFKDADKLAYVMDRAGRAIKDFTKDISTGLSELEWIEDQLKGKVVFE